ncbi:MAG: dimethylsulfoxide reductase subunit B [Anaerolineales bacterium]|nr:dimethylsulfoxide reductase subunit B [Anaerolineales bacterium]
MAKQMAFYFDASACIGCKVCQVACQDKNNLAPDILWRRVFTYGNGSWIKISNTYIPNNVTRYFISTACQHCENPLCRNVCPTTAISKSADGIVLINADKCIGCRYCEWACPYGALQFNEETNAMTKCDFCEDLLAQGNNPACVDACVMRCLDFGDLNELRMKYGNLAAIEPLPSDEITHPSFVLTPHKHTQLTGQGTGRILNLPEEL